MINNDRIQTASQATTKEGKINRKELLRHKLDKFREISRGDWWNCLKSTASIPAVAGSLIEWPVVLATACLSS